MKVVICSAAPQVEFFAPGKEGWASCACGNVQARWEDPAAGTLAVTARDPDRVRVLGLSNHLLLPALAAAPSSADLRRLHDRATAAPGFVFDKEKAGCWAVVFRVGSTSDTRWVPPAEAAW